MEQPKWLHTVTASNAAILEKIKPNSPLAQTQRSLQDIRAQHKTALHTYQISQKRASQALSKLGKEELNVLHSVARFSAVFEKMEKPTELPEYQKLCANVGSANDLKQFTLKTSAFFTHYTSYGVDLQIQIASGGAIPFLLQPALFPIALHGALIHVFFGDKLAQLIQQQVLNTEEEIQNVIIQLKKCTALFDEIADLSTQYFDALSQINQLYLHYLAKQEHLVVENGKTNWRKFSLQEKRITETTIRLAQTVFAMCKLELITPPQGKNELAELNRKGAQQNLASANKTIKQTK